jgi:hypothetical protein
MAASYHENMVSGCELEYQALIVLVAIRSSYKRTFKPTPPAFKLTTSTLPFLEKDLNSLIAALFFLTSIVPSNRY